MEKDTPGVKIEFVNHDHKLTIDSAHYAGTVLCRAENVVGRFETKARLNVIPQEKPKKAPRFSELLSDKTETEGNTVVFEGASCFITPDVVLLGMMSKINVLFV
ncbi:unnamed protein product [Strongylus vulgaris]|uniref:Immunoglobulin I-set domain-containing protein n=1 Tax=Strongylus vulgaris TaxID=40348 RepID=A0A3P7LSA0_STRVU|nr:unnamed protein product [Strongylus vulgaris]